MIGNICDGLLFDLHNREFTVIVFHWKWMFSGCVSQVISGHLGWVRSIAVEPGNQWFVTGSADRTIKVI